MTVREGSLEAPTRHPIDWQSPDYGDEAKIVAEMGRVFDICHGCRRCVSLCNTFPTLFSLVDETDGGEVEGVAKEKYWDVVDQCYMCDLCYVVKCPYVPPHPWNVDFPHTMLRAKAIKFKKGLVKRSERFLASTDVHGQFAGIPIVVQAVNAVNRTKTARKLMDATLDVHPTAWMPELATSRFRWSAKKQGSATEVRDGERSPGKVAIFSTCVAHEALKLGAWIGILVCLGGVAILSVRGNFANVRQVLADLTHKGALYGLLSGAIFAIAAGGIADVVDLPKTGIKGNSHMMMMDKNNTEVAALIQTWLEGKELTKKP